MDNDVCVFNSQLYNYSDKRRVAYYSLDDRFCTGCLYNIKRRNEGNDWWELGGMDGVRKEALKEGNGT